MVDDPDQIVTHQVNWCECCGKDLSNQLADSLEHRQVYDIPPMKLLVTQHQVEMKKCICGHHNKALFPAGVDHYVGYDPNLKGFVVYLQNYQLLPSKRTQELILDLFDQHISTGTLFNFGNLSFNRLAKFGQHLKGFLACSPIAGFDETGFKVMKKRLWLHSCSTAKYAYYAVHPKRGTEAMDDIEILPNFKGIAVHDFWRSYFSYSCQHSLCNAHNIRELTFVKERFEQQWAQQLIDLLLKMKSAKYKALQKGKDRLSKSRLRDYRKAYDSLIKKGIEENPFKPPKIKKRGRIKKSIPQNLLIRLRDHADDYLRFLYDFNVPFDNNFSKRDIRMIKVKQKISGCFRSFRGAKIFARIRSYIMTARKQGINTYKALID